MFGRKRSKDDETRYRSGDRPERLQDLLMVHVPPRGDDLPKRRPRGRAALLHPDDEPEPPR